jgi:hypothetical protein
VPKEVIPASRKLGRTEAADLAASVDKVTIAKGKKVASFTVKGKVPDEVIDGMLGPTGNLRAPTLINGKHLIVGFHEEVYQKLLFD